MTTTIWKSDLRFFDGLMEFVNNNREDCTFHQNFIRYYGNYDAYIECKRYAEKQKKLLCDLDRALSEIDYTNKVRIKHLVMTCENKYQIEDIIKYIYRAFNYESGHYNHVRILEQIK